VSIVRPLFSIDIATEIGKKGFLPKFDSKILINRSLVSNASDYVSLVEPAFWANLPLRPNHFRANSESLKPARVPLPESKTKL